ncbi:MAG: hypothetical protein ACYSWO_28685 [Planctomycetota bacterium]|jgi:hypothetical protein
MKSIDLLRLPGRLVLNLGPAAAFLLCVVHADRLALLLLIGWAMAVTSVLTVRGPS